MHSSHCCAVTRLWAGSAVDPSFVLIPLETALFYKQKLSPGWINTQKYKFLLIVLTQMLGMNVRLLVFSSFPILLLLHWDNS